MFLVQILLPLYDSDDQRYARESFESVARELVDHFGGMTAYTNAPARGLWENDGGRTERDDIVVHEVMAESLERSWWTSYRKVLEARFAQAEVVVRAFEMQRL
jgi:hypothetical protein